MNVNILSLEISIHNYIRNQTLNSALSWWKTATKQQQLTSLSPCEVLQKKKKKKNRFLQKI